MTLTAEALLDEIAAYSDLEADSDADTPLFSSGVLDSVSMLNLIMFVEQHSGIEVRADEVTLDNFDTAGRIVRFVEARAA